MTTIPHYQEEISSQIPALQVLMNMGYTYLPPDEALGLRDGKKGQVILTGVLEPWLRENNQVTFKRQTVPFSDANIREAIRRLDVDTHTGLINANAEAYELLTLGTSLEQTIDGDRKSYSLHYIDWRNPANNVYHVTDEYIVEKRGSQQTRRPDIVVFVNGIPLVIIECKRPDLVRRDQKPVAEAITQMLRNQKPEEIPHLFVYSQLLLALARNDGRYATVGAGPEFWSLWREEAAIDDTLAEIINQPLSAADKDRLYSHRKYARSIRPEFEAMGERLPSEQDRLLFSLLHPERLLEITYQYLVFDDGVKKVARYQQYFAIQHTIDRVASLNAQGERTGGVIWHTTGSGKSLTMVMLAKALSLHPAIKNPRVVIVTDRINLDTQIWSTFRACGKQAEKARSGRHLVELVQSSRADIITTVIDKFERAAIEKISDDNPNVFVLVDESHRSQYGQSHARMRQVFPAGCYIGFTGTPLMSKDKKTAERFGGFIHKYTMRQAVEDGSVVPLLYEGRLADLEVDDAMLDRWFERETEDLSEEQINDLKKQMSRSDEVQRIQTRVHEISYDIARHYKDTFRGTGFKGQLATPSKDVAVRYLKYLRDRGINAALLISGPDTREGSEDIYSTSTTPVQDFWRRMMQQYGNEERYNNEIKASFAQEDGIEILVVVDKLLVGFDEPRNTVLYIDKPLRNHGILQAIARVNRLFEGKDFGYVIDYRGILGELNEAMEVYSALEDFDAEDVAGVVVDVAKIIDELPGLHERLWGIFKTVRNKHDLEALEQYLEPEDVRDEFYEALTDFASALKVALSTVEFHERVPENRQRTYKEDLKFFHNLRASVKRRYAEAVDYREYEQKIRKLMDTHIKARDVETITELVNIFDSEAFAQEVERLSSPRAKADTILHRMQRTINEKFDEDPDLYRQFSEMVEETIRLYKEGRLTESEYHQHADELRRQMVEGLAPSGRPAKLADYRDAGAFYGAMQETFERHGEGWDQGEFNELLADIAIEIEEAIEAHKVRDWTTNQDVQKSIRRAIDDILYELKSRHKIDLTGGEMDEIINRILETAKRREYQ